MMRKKTKENGITLVALIITILVLVILAAVSINAVFKAQFIDLATQGTINYAEAQANEEKKMNDLDGYMKNIIQKIEYKNIGNNGDSDNPTNPPINSNTAPYNITTNAPEENRTTTSLTIVASATDDEQTTLYYDLYWNGSNEVTETITGTRGETVTFTTITDLTEATKYSWKVIVQDHEGGMSDLLKACKTNCSGLGAPVECEECHGWRLRVDSSREVDSIYVDPYHSQSGPDLRCVFCGDTNANHPGTYNSYQWFLVKYKPRYSGDDTMPVTYRYYVASCWQHAMGGQYKSKADIQGAPYLIEGMLDRHQLM